ncbi:hypothetical protein PFISCL1PPCAC_3238, partial [Pristionchus fissidentatus]
SGHSVFSRPHSVDSTMQTESSKSIDYLSMIFLPASLLLFFGSFLCLVVCCFQYKALDVELEDIELEETKKQMKWCGEIVSNKKKTSVAIQSPKY